MRIEALVGCTVVDCAAGGAQVRMMFVLLLVPLLTDGAVYKAVAATHGVSKDCWQDDEDNWVRYCCQCCWCCWCWRRRCYCSCTC